MSFGLCIVCRDSFHGNCRPFVCRNCGSATHQRCAKPKPKIGTDFLCIRCVDETERRIIVGPRVLPPELPSMTREIPITRRGIDCSVGSSTPRVRPFSPGQDYSPKHLESPLEHAVHDNSIYAEQSAESDSSSSESSDESEEGSTSSRSLGQTVVDIEASDNCQKIGQPILKSLVSGIRGNFLAFLIVSVVLLCIFLAFVCFAFFGGHRETAVNDRIANFASMFSPTSRVEGLPSRMSFPTSRVEDFSSTENITLVATSTRPSLIRQMVSFTQFICSEIDRAVYGANHICRNDTLGLCVAVPGAVPNLPTRINPSQIVSSQLKNLCKGNSIFEIDA